MHTGQRYTFKTTLNWSRRNVLGPMLWASVVTSLHEVAGLKWLALPWLPISLVGVAVAFYLGFKNNASYDRVWEARKIWGAIVNASRSWAWSARDLVSGHWADEPIPEAELQEARVLLVRRHVAWMDALRHQLRRIKSWEHSGGNFDRFRKGASAPEYSEDLEEVLTASVGADEARDVLSKINPAAHLLANQSRDLNALFERGAIDSFRHMELQKMLTELVAQQGKAERIKNFPFPRQYTTVNTYFAWLLVALLPLGMCHEFAKLGGQLVWLSIPFTAIVGWVFLTADQIGEWSENPFEGLTNDVPISSMARGIERDILEIVGVEELPAPRESIGPFIM